MKAEEQDAQESKETGQKRTPLGNVCNSTGLNRMNQEKKGDQPGFTRLRLESFEERLCVQIMHIGPYATEPATVARMQAFAAENGYTMSGKHHEIYMGNPLRADPDKLKTVLRHAVVKPPVP